MADLLKQRDQIIKSVDFMLEGTYPGGQEDKHQPQHSEQASNEDDPLLRSGQNSIHWLQLPYPSKVLGRKSFSVLETSRSRTNKSLQ